SASARTKPITVSQPPVDVISNVVCAMCNKCLISVNHDKCLRNYVNDKISCGKKQKAKVSFKEIQKKYQPKVMKPNKVGTLERLATPKPGKPRFLLRWSPTGRLFDQEGKLVASSTFESQYDCSNGDNACTSNAMEPKIKRFLNSTSLIDRNDIVSSLLKFKYHKEHLCPSCEQGRSKRASHPPKPVPNSRQRLHLLHMDLCGPMRIASINEKRYVLVIVDDYSRYTWIHFLRSKDEAPEVIIKFLKRITVLLHSPVIIIRTDNDTEFKNQVLKEYFDTVGISHQMSSIRTPQQNGVVERQNQTLVEAARTMLIFSRAPLFLWAEAIATACFTQNRTIIHHIGKLGAKCDIEFFIGYSADSCAYRVYNRRTKKIMGTMNVSFDELSAMAFEQRSSKPGLPTTARTVPPAQEPQVCQSSTASTTIADTAPTPTNSSSHATYTSTVSTTIADTAPIPTNSSFHAKNIPITSQYVDELNPNAMVDAMAFEQSTSKLGLQCMTPGQISSGLDLTYAPSTITTQQPTEGELDSLFEAMYDDYFGGQPLANVENVPTVQEPQVY
nr:putative ribonuclease H-like domain-containing protein [Tanacetum cinerariifolium]